MKYFTWIVTLVLALAMAAPLYAADYSLGPAVIQHSQHHVLVDSNGWRVGSLAAQLFHHDDEDNEPIILARQLKGAGWMPAVWCDLSSAAFGMQAAISF